MAKKGTRYGNDRTKLEEVIPLETPLLLFVDPSSMCNFRCSFCPCGGAHKEIWSNNKRTNIMSYELYRKVIDDLTEFDSPLKTLRLYKEGEPLLNKRLPDMINYARKKKITKRIDFTTNGSMLEKDLALAILDAGIDRIHISVEALTAEEYFNISGVKLDFDKYLDRLEFLYENRGNTKIFIKISDAGLGKHSEDEFVNIFGGICDEYSIEHITPVWPEFKLNDNIRTDYDHNIYGDSFKESNNMVCPYIFYSLCVNSDGTVSACLMDWNHQLIVGNVNELSLKEIWNSEKMNDMRKNHLMLQKFKYQTCNECGQLEYAALDNITPYRKKIIEKMRF